MHACMHRGGRDHTTTSPKRVEYLMHACTEEGGRVGQLLTISYKRHALRSSRPEYLYSEACLSVWDSPCISQRDLFSFPNAAFCKILGHFPIDNQHFGGIEEATHTTSDRSTQPWKLSPIVQASYQNVYTGLHAPLQGGTIPNGTGLTTLNVCNIVSHIAPEAYS